MLSSPSNNEICFTVRGFALIKLNVEDNGFLLQGDRADAFHQGNSGFRLCFSSGYKINLKIAVLSIDFNM